VLEVQVLTIIFAPKAIPGAVLMVVTEAEADIS
jgi:hypothetical protein